MSADGSEASKREMRDATAGARFPVWRRFRIVGRS
jgi:hypothetical protein